MKRTVLLLLAAMAADRPGLIGATAVPLAPYAVLATRTASPALNQGPAAVFNVSQLDRSPSLALDDALRASAAFGLFRRSGSLTANPTAQGVSLRGIGPSGTSRSIVVYDGVPVNDPFGGWVLWTKLPRTRIAEVRLVNGADASAWGSAALGGAVEILSAAPAPGGSVELTGGDFGTAAGALAAGGSNWVATAEEFRTAGFPLVAAGQRGPVDIAADSRHRLGTLSLRIPAGAAVARLEARVFDEERGNGTPLQRNATRDLLVSGSVEGAASWGQWSAVAYGERERFRSFFSSVSANRATETPANDQYAVPADAAGAAVAVSLERSPGVRTLAGADFRWVEGETRERFLYSAPSGTFTRLRAAGGRQSIVGAFLNEEKSSGAWRASLGLRLDSWLNAGGRRRESDIVTGVPTRADDYPARAGVELSPSARLERVLSPGLSAHVAIGRGFRLPTLNEYYRPFRVGAVNTEANPNLGLEAVQGGEIGLNFTGKTADASIAGFLDDLRDAVTNVTIATNSRERRNLPLVRIPGFQATAAWHPLPMLRLDADWLVNLGRVRRTGAAASGLKDKHLPQVPTDTVAAGIGWKLSDSTEFTARLRWTGRQYEDDENRLPLASAAPVDLGLSQRLGARTRISLSLENALDERVETGRGADGVISVGPPRFLHAALRREW